MKSPNVTALRRRDSDVRSSRWLCMSYISCGFNHAKASRGLLRNRKNKITAPNTIHPKLDGCLENAYRLPVIALIARLAPHKRNQGVNAINNALYAIAWRMLPERRLSSALNVPHPGHSIPSECNGQDGNQAYASGLPHLITSSPARTPKQNSPASFLSVRDDLAITNTSQFLKNSANKGDDAYN